MLSSPRTGARLDQLKPSGKHALARAMLKRPFNHRRKSMIAAALALRIGYGSLAATTARVKRCRITVFSLLAAAVFVFAAHARAVVPAASVEGPIPATVAPGNPIRDYPLFATDRDLAGAGYVEEEYFLSGTASRYATPAGATGSVIDSGHAYKTRMVVRRPVDPKKFNGVVILEWYNVTPGYDNEYGWLQSGAHFVRTGYAYAAISAQAVGFGGVTGVNRLKAWSPARYGTLDVTRGGQITDDALSYDIFAQAAQALRNPTGIRPLGSLNAHMVLASGESQSASRLTTYINSVHPLHKVIDALLLHSGGSDLIRNDPGIPVFRVWNENDLLITFPTVLNKFAVRQPDTDRLRTWEIAGTSHSDWQFYLAATGHLTARELGLQPPDARCDLASRSRVPTHYVLNAAYDHLVRWAMQGVQPPTAPRIEADGSPLQMRRDRHGNALGGIRLAEVAVPTALESGQNSGQGPLAVTCALRGAHVPFSDDALSALYPSHQAYVSAVRQATEPNVNVGYMLAIDGRETVEKASASIVGKRMNCGPLCQNVGAGMDSISKLRDQTAYFDNRGKRGARLVDALDKALEHVAAGDTLRGGRRASEHYDLAARSLAKYLLEVNGYRRAGLMQEWTAYYLMSAAQSLISDVEKASASVAMAPK
jgi:hypothetical protein